MKTRCSPVVVLAVLVSLALVLNGCGSATSPSSSSGASSNVGEPYKIGAVFDITGSASSLGVPQRDTTQLLQEALDASDGILGPDGLRHPVRIVVYDTESDETKTVLAVKKLIEEDKVAVIVGPTQSGTTLAVIDTVQKAEIPLISCAASIKIIDPVAERKWVFKTAPSDRLVVAALVNHLKAEGIARVAWMSVNNAFGDSGRVEFEAAAPGAGITIVNSEKFEATDTDMTAQLTKVKAGDAQALVIWSTPPSASAATKTAFDLGLTIPVFHSHGVGNQKFIELATKEAAEGVVFPIGKIVVADQLPDSDPQKAVLLQYVQEYKAKFGTAPVTFGGHAWDGIKLAVQILEKVGPDRTKIRDELEKTTGFAGIGGLFSFSPSEHGGLDPSALTLVKIVDGQWKLVVP